MLGGLDSRNLLMLNLYESVRTNPSYSKLVIGVFLFAEYTCGVTAKKLPSFTETEIAFQSGFKDVSHFSRVFKARFGVPPLAYRQETSVPA